ILSHILDPNEQPEQPSAVSVTAPSPRHSTKLPTLHRVGGPSICTLHILPGGQRPKTPHPPPRQAPQVTACQIRWRADGRRGRIARRKESRRGGNDHLKQHLDVRREAATSRPAHVSVNSTTG